MFTSSMFDFRMIVVVAVVAAAVASAWAGAIRRWIRRQPLVPHEPQGTVPWVFWDLLVAIGLLLSFGVLALALLRAGFGLDPEMPAEEAPAPALAAQLVLQSLSMLAALATTAVWISVRSEATLADFGLRRARLWYDVRLGVWMFFLLAPPTYALQLILVRWIESKHPIVKLIEGNPDPRLIAASLFSAVIVAPVAEEFLFRVLLQGWLQKLVGLEAYGPAVSNPQDGPAPEAEGRSDQTRTIEPLSGQWQGHVEHVAEPTEFAAPGASSRPGGTDSAPQPQVQPGNAAAFDQERPSPRFPLGLLPIAGSAALFAALHVSHGPDWIPLFLLALGLGYLYRQTHRLVPCIVVHLLLNACSMTAFLYEIFRA